MNSFVNLGAHIFLACLSIFYYISNLMVWGLTDMIKKKNAVFLQCSASLLEEKSFILRKKSNIYSV